MSLDDRLKVIVEDASDISSGFDNYGAPTAEEQELMCEEIVAQIKQAFADEEEWFHRGEIVLREDATEYIPVAMTGQEWYDRYNTELDKVLPHELKGHQDDVIIGLQTVIDTAAKRAAGLGEDNAG